MPSSTQKIPIVLIVLVQSIPTVRQLAVQLEINANTVSRVYSELEAEGYLLSQQGRGTFVANKVEDLDNDKVKHERLEQLVEKVLMEAYKLGYTSQDVLRYLERKLEREEKDGKGSPPALIKIGVFFGLTVISIGFSYYVSNLVWIPIGLLLATIMTLSVYVVAQWEQVVVLRFGKFKRLLKPGLAFVIPFIDSVAQRVDQRIRIITFVAEKTLTKDTVPVDVDAVLFWLVYDVKKAVLEVSDYEKAVSWAAQTTLREIIGSTMLSDLLSNRAKLDQELVKAIDQKTEPWGITVQSVELRDISIPQILQDAMSREAQAERERQARVLLSRAELDMAEQLVNAAAYYQDNPTALKLRFLNILSEGVKNKGCVFVVPSDMVQSMGILGMTATGSETNGVKQEVGATSRG